MPKYWVEVPIAGYVGIEVEAENEEEAVNAALEKGAGTEDIQEWDMYEKLIEGHVMRFYRNEVDVTEMEDDA